MFRQNWQTRGQIQAEGVGFLGNQGVNPKKKTGSLGCNQKKQETLNETNFSQIQTDTELGKRLCSVLSSFQDEGISVKECQYALYPQLLLSPEGLLKSLSDSCRNDKKKKRYLKSGLSSQFPFNPLKNSSSGESCTEHTKPERSKTILRPHPRP